MNVNCIEELSEKHKPKINKKDFFSNQTKTKIFHKNEMK